MGREPDTPRRRRAFTTLLVMSLTAPASLRGTSGRTIAAGVVYGQTTYLRPAATLVEISVTNDCLLTLLEKSG